MNKLNEMILKYRCFINDTTYEFKYVWYLSPTFHKEHFNKLLDLHESIERQFILVYEIANREDFLNSIVGYTNEVLRTITNVPTEFKNPLYLENVSIVTADKIHLRADNNYLNLDLLITRL